MFREQLRLFRMPEPPPPAKARHLVLGGRIVEYRVKNGVPMPKPLRDTVLTEVVARRDAVHDRMGLAQQEVAGEFMDHG